MVKFDDINRDIANLERTMLLYIAECEQGYRGKPTESESRVKERARKRAVVLRTDLTAGIRKLQGVVTDCVHFPD